MLKNRHVISSALLLSLALVGCAGKSPSTPAGENDVASSESEGAASSEFEFEGLQGGSSEDDQAQNRLQAVSFEDQADHTLIRVEGTSPMSPNIFKLTDPDRIIVDLTDTSMGDVVPSVDVGVGEVEKITVDQFDDAQSSLSRLVITLKSPVDYTLSSEGSALLMSVPKLSGNLDDQAVDDQFFADSDAQADFQDEPSAPEPEASIEDSFFEAPSDTGVGSLASESLADPATQLLDVKSLSEGGSLKLVFSGDGAMPNTTPFLLDNPSRLVVDLPGLKNGTGGIEEFVVDQPSVKRVRLGQNADRLRLVFDLEKSDPAYDIVASGNALEIKFQNAGGAMASSAGDDFLEPDSGVGFEPESSDGFVGTGFADNALDSGPTVSVTNVAFKQMPGSNKSRLVVTLTEPTSDFQVSELGGNLSLSVGNAKFSDPIYKRYFDTREFNTAITKVVPEKRGDSVQFLVELEQMVPYTTNVSGNEIWLDVDIPSSLLRERTGSSSSQAASGGDFEVPPVAQVDPASSEDPMEDADMFDEPADTASSDPQKEQLLSAALPSKKKDYSYVKEEFMSESLDGGSPLSRMGAILAGRLKGKEFSGRKISLDFKDADVRSIFRLIADISKFNIIISDNVKGRVTIRLDDVPWDQAFAIILQTRGLWFERYGNIIRVAPADKLRAEREAAAAAAKAAEAAKPLDVLFKPVSFAQAGTLIQQVNSVLTGRGSVDIDSRTNTLIIKDIRENLEKARRMVDILDTQTPQVSIESRIVEATTTFTRSFGITWGGNARFTTATGNPTGLFFPNDVSVSPFALNFPVEAGFINSTANIKMGSINNIIDLDLALALGEQEGQSKLISAPKVTVLDNSTASIQAGSMIPFLTQTANAGSNVRFQNATTSLNVTPHITNEGSILMQITATRNQPNFAQLVDGNPLIDQRSANTEVLVKSGNTTVLGGIYSTERGRSISRLPFISRIPIIGALFRNYDKQLRRSELLIFVTPRIIGDEREAIREVRE